MKSTTKVIPMPRRRAAVILNYAMYPVMGLFMGEMLTDSKWINIVGILLTAGLIFGTLIYLYANTNLWNLGNAPDKDLDERQVQVRNNAYRHAYTVMASLVVLFGLYYAIALDKEVLWIPQTYDQASYFLWGAILLTMTLPSAILAWTEPEV